MQRKGEKVARQGKKQSSPAESFSTGPQTQKSVGLWASQFKGLLVIWGNDVAVEWGTVQN